MIFGPVGRPLCQAIPQDRDGILYADVDIGMIALAKAAADPVGHYSRPDVVRLMLNRTKNSRVHSFRKAMLEVAAERPSEGDGDEVPE